MPWRTSRVAFGQQGALDRVVIAYVALPLPKFLLGWFQLWVAVPLTLCVLYALRPLIAPRATGRPGAAAGLRHCLGT
jgi:hypothetical protein